jgi:cytochrome oxidase assembly protein ShyY1
VLRLQRHAIARLVPYPIAPYQLILIEDSATHADDGPGYGGGDPAPFGTAVVDSTRPVRIPLPALDEGPHKSYAVQWFAFAAIALIGTAAVVRGEWTRTL